MGAGIPAFNTGMLMQELNLSYGIALKLVKFFDCLRNDTLEDISYYKDGLLFVSIYIDSYK